MSHACATSELIRQFLAGVLSSDEEDAVASHLDDCPDCEQLAATLSDDYQARELAAARGTSAAPIANEEVHDLCRRLHALGLLELAFRSNVESDTSPQSGDDSALLSFDGGEGDASGDGLGWHVRAEGEHDELGLTDLGPYQILQVLGSGSFGIVYLARDRRLNRRVAIKVARASVLADPDLRARFFREAEALARLEHPHILPVYEANEIEGLCFLVLAYCEGPTLEAWLRDRAEPLEPELSARIVLRLAEAVEHAHSRGILHRDIKPGNILLPVADTSEDLPFSPKLTDFGLAKMVEEEQCETLAGMVLGTAHYMAPEQAAGHLERIGPATDVYSLGAILYQLLSGRVPIEGKSTIDTLRRLLIDEPPEVQQVVSGVPDDLGAIVRKCLHKGAAQRYQTARDLADDLGRFLAGKPTKARPLGIGERCSRWLAQQRALVPLLALAVTVIGLSLGLFHYADRLSRTQHQVQRTAEALDQAKERAESDALYLARQAYANDLFAAGRSTANGDIPQAMEALRRQLPTAAKRDLRGLEWHYLWAYNTHQPQVYRNADTEIYQLRLSPDGREVAAVGKDGLLRLYESKGLTLQVTLQTNQTEVNGVAYSPNGRLAATAGDDGTIRIFNLATREQWKKIAAHRGKAFGVVFFDGQKKLASCGNDPVIRLWDVETCELIGTLDEHQGSVEAIAVSASGDRLVSAGSDKKAIVWDLTTKKLLRSLVGHRGAVMSVCFSPDGAWVATGAMDNVCYLWNARTGRPLDQTKVLDRVQSVAFSADGRQLYVGDRSGSVHKYRLESTSAPNSRVKIEEDSTDSAWHAHATRIYCVTPGSSPDTFYTAGEDRMLRRWDRRPQNRAEQSIPTRLGDLFIDLDYSPDGKLLFVLHETSGITVHDATTLQPMFTLDCHHSDWRTVKVLAGRDEVAAGNAHGIVAIWNYKTGALRRIISPNNEDVSIVDLAYSPQRELLVVSPYELDEVLVYKAASGELVARLPTTNHTAVAISRDGRRIAVDWLDDIRVFDVDTRQQFSSFGGHMGTINSLAFSPDGKLIASGSVDRTVQLWTVEGEHLATPMGHLADVTEVAFTPDGRTLLSTDERGALGVTHVASKQPLFELPAPAERFRGLAISPDSRSVAAIRTLKGQHDVVVLGPPPSP